MRSTIPNLVLGIGVLFLAGCTDVLTTQRPTVWRFAIEEVSGSVQDEYAQRFAQLVHERTGGNIEVKVYPVGTLGTSDQITEQLHLGAIQFVMASPGLLGKLIPEVQVFLLHHVLSGDQEVNRDALRPGSAVYPFFRALYREKGLELLTFFTEGWMAWTAAAPIRSPQDFRGLKIRVMTTPLLLQTYAAYGANPTPLEYSEVYSALQLSMIDGQVNPVFAIEEMKFYEVSGAMMFPKQAEFVTSMMTSQRFFDRLPPPEREMVTDIVAELHDYIFAIQQRLNRERLEAIRESKPDLEIVELTEAERNVFKHAAKSVHRSFVESVGERAARALEAVERAVREAEQAIGEQTEHETEQPAAGHDVAPSRD